MFAKNLIKSHNVEGLSPEDVYRIWLSYEIEMYKYLINPTKPNFKFFNSFYFSISGRKLKNHLTRYRHYLLNPNKKLHTTYEKSILKIESIDKLINQKLEYFDKLTNYLEGYDQAKLDKAIILWKEIKIISDDIKTIITRDLEK